MNDIAIDKQNGILQLAFNRPQKKHAINPEMYETLIAALNSAVTDEAVKVVQLSADGDYFSAGNDREGFKIVRDLPYPKRPGFRFMNTLATFPKPVVAAVNGHAIGIAVTLLLHCDMVYAAKGVELRMPFIDIGLLPEFASTLLLPQMLGHSRAAEILMLGDPVKAERAAELGIINACVDSQELASFSKDICRKLAEKYSHALVTTKRLMKKPLLESIVKTIEEETIELSACLNKLVL